MARILYSRIDEDLRLGLQVTMPDKNGNVLFITGSGTEEMAFTKEAAEEILDFLIFATSPRQE